MKKASYHVGEFSIEKLAEALANKNLNPNRVKELKFRALRYYADYLGPEGLDAKTMVIENGYISKSYLNDFASYYSLCFKDYDRKTKRIHFFNFKFNDKDFEEAILNHIQSGPQKIWDSYLGFIVAKPLPDAVIGPTLLKTYNDTEEYKRKFCVRKYPINLFGKKIKLKSLAFQEQDTVVSACATMAIWSAFHKTSMLFQTHLPNPSEITKSAGNRFLQSGRTFPNSGLDLFQIGKTIENNGLVSELRNKEKEINDAQWLKSFVYAYNRCGIPVLLGISIENIGQHLITITGYRIPDKIPDPKKEISLVSEQIEKFYAHDDQIGPFSRLEFSGNDIITSWPTKNDFSKRKKATVTAVIVPLYSKIRITYENIITKVRWLHFLFQTMKLKSDKLYWDIYLESSNKYKIEVRNNLTIPLDIKQAILFQNFPKYIWVAKAISNNDDFVHLIFDSTDISRGLYLVEYYFMDITSADSFADIIKLNSVSDFIITRLGQEYLDFFEKKSGNK